MRIGPASQTRLMDETWLTRLPAGVQPRLRERLEHPEP